MLKKLMSLILLLSLVSPTYATKTDIVPQGYDNAGTLHTMPVTLEVEALNFDV